MTYFYHAVVDSPYIPRDAEHGSANNLVLSLLGDFWPYAEPVRVPSAAVVSLLGNLDSTELATRAALSRLARKGAIVQTKDGRRTFYQLAPEVAASTPAGEYLTMSFGAGDREWDGEWTVIVFSVPETQRDVRHNLRTWLRWLGFGPVRDGVWIAPHADIDLTQHTLRGILPDDGLVFRSSHISGEIRHSEVWPLDEIANMYREFAAELHPILYRLREGSVSPADGFRILMDVTGKWRRFPTMDPDLPADALPADWPRRIARRLFVDVHDAVAPLAELHVRRAVAEHDTDAASHARCMAVDECLEFYAPTALSAHSLTEQTA